ncbi:MAG TPA: hypothetical protein VF608_14315, partial [Thermoanaerobaculia bacterium]
MKFRYAFLFLGVVLVASVASADCLTCQRIGPLTNPATCRPATEWEGDICSGICCYSEYGTPCTQPDMAYPCYSFRAATRGKYFTTKAAQQEATAALYLRLGNSLKPVKRPNCRANTA